MAQTGELADFEFYKRHLVTDCEYRCEIDEFRRNKTDGTYDQMLFCHIKFLHFSPGIFKRFLRDWHLFRKCVPTRLYAIRGEVEEAKFNHFVTRIGFTPTNIHIPCHNGEIRQLFITV